MIRLARAEQKNELIELYNHCFPGEESFCNWFFDNIWIAESSLVFIEDDKVCAMLNMLPDLLEYDHSRVKYTYLYALGTYSAYRGRGFMAQLLDEAAQMCKAQGISHIALITQDDSLFRFYNKNGYENTFYVSQNSCKPCELPQEYSIMPLGPYDYENVVQIYNDATTGVWRGERSYDFMCCIHEVYDGCYVLRKRDEIYAYVIGCSMGEEFKAVECIGKDCDKLMGALANMYGAKSAAWKSVAKESNSVPIGCILSLDSQIEVDKTYLNLMFN